MMPRRTLPLVLLVAVVVAGASATFAAQAIHEDATELPWTWTLGSYRETANVVVGDTNVTVEISDTPELRERGLSYHAELSLNSGMLFVYTDSGRRIYWMKGMEYCLDIVWINDGVIVGAAESVCPEPGVADADLGRYGSPSPVQYVLELPAGWLREHGYTTGTPVTIPASIGG